jgi:hypothetical protein
MIDEKDLRRVSETIRADASPTVIASVSSSEHSGSALKSGVSQPIGPSSPLYLLP